ncbi:MAG: IPT/TIG domain-containing protein [bacterium]
MKHQTMRYAFYALLLLALGTAGWANPPVVGNTAKDGIPMHPMGFSEQTTMFFSVDPPVVPWTGQPYTNGSLTVTLSGEVTKAGDVVIFDPSGAVYKTISFPVIDESTHHASYSYTIDNVVYPAAVGTHVFTAKSGRVNGTKLEASASVRVNAPPTITALNPTTGVAGNTMTITGTNLAGATAVTFNGTAAEFTVVNGTTITTTVPSGATTGPIAVTVPGGGTVTSGTFTLATVTPDAGIQGEPPVTITGTGFIGASDVKIGDISIPDYAINQAGTTIIFPIPYGVLVTGKQVVTVTLADATVVNVGTFYVVPKVKWTDCWDDYVDEDGNMVVGVQLLLTDNNDEPVINHDLTWRIDKIYNANSVLVYSYSIDDDGVFNGTDARGENDDYGDFLAGTNEWDYDGYHWSYFRLGTTEGQVFIAVDDYSID